MLRMRLFPASLLLTSTVLALGQNPPAAFDVVSLKADSVKFIPGVPLVPFACRGTDAVAPPRREAPTGMCSGTKVSVQVMLGMAYDINPDVKAAIDGAPAWLDQERYAIQAKAATAPTLRELRAMLQTMLADKFKLRAHLETRELDGLALIVGRSGPKFQESSGQEDPRGNNIGFRLRMDGGVAAPPDSLMMNFANVGMDEVARLLATQLHRPVANRTNLTGNYNIHIPSFAPSDNPNSDSPALTNSIEEVGLKLEVQKISLPVLVIDYMEKPTLD